MDLVLFTFWRHQLSDQTYPPVAVLWSRGAIVILYYIYIYIYIYVYIYVGVAIVIIHLAKLNILCIVSSVVYQPHFCLTLWSQGGLQDITWYNYAFIRLLCFQHVVHFDKLLFLSQFYIFNKVGH